MGNYHIQKVMDDIKKGNVVLALEGLVFEKLISFYETD